MAIPDRTLRITKLAVVESLRVGDGHTGEKLAREVGQEHAAAGIGIAIQVFRCDGVDGFRQVIALLAEEARKKEHHPILHIECHGDDLLGLEFGDGSVLPWDDLMDILRPLNEATELGLIVSVAACFGLGAIRGVSLTDAAPYFALVGPSEGIWSNELFDALKGFYLDLTYRTSTAEAVEKLRQVQLESGGFEVITARQWFRLIMLHYLDENTSVKERKAQAMRQHRRALAEGLILGLTYWKRHFVATLPSFLREYHRRFFMTDRFPQHASHFAASMRDIEDELRRRGFT